MSIRGEQMRWRASLRLSASLVLLLGTADCVAAEGTGASEAPVAATPERASSSPAAPPAPGEAPARPSPPTPAASPKQVAQAPASSPPATQKQATPKRTEGTAPAPRASGATAEPASGPSSEQTARSVERLGLDLSSDAPLEIDSRLIDIQEIDGGGERIRFSGGVTLTQGALKLTCAVLDAYYPKGAQGRPDRIVADGDVVVVQNEMELRCTRAEFDDSKCRTICLSSEQCGSPNWPAKPARLTRGDNSIEGRQLEFDLCTSRLSGSCGARVVLNPERKPTAEATAATPARGSGAAPTENPPATPSGKTPSGKGVAPGGTPDQADGTPQAVSTPPPAEKPAP